MKRAILLLLLISLSFASEVWHFASSGAITIKPIVYQDSIVVASDDGNVYSLSDSGMKRWQLQVGKSPNELLPFDGAIAVSTTGGKVVKIGPTGSALWSVDLNATNYNVSHVYGASANQNFIFVTTNNGVYALEKGGTVRPLVSFDDSTMPGAPAAGTDYVVYGKGNGLFKVSQSGVLAWNSTLERGSFWLSRPVIDGNSIYVGALDNKMHSFVASNGAEIWSVRTKNWVAGTALVSSGAVYFGSDDGTVYAVDSNGGNTRWAAQTQLAIQTQPEVGTLGGKEVVFIGGSDRSIYAISTDTGEILWKTSVGSAVGSPLFYKNLVVFGAADGVVYAYDTERACSITQPMEGDIQGPKELVVSGKYVSQSSGPTVYVGFNEGGNWQQTNTTEDGWFYYVDPKTVLNPDLNTISCKLADDAGEEGGPKYTTVSLNYDPNIPPSELKVAVSSNIIEKKPFTVFVNDGDDGSPVDRFSLLVQGKEYKGDKNVTLTLQEPGAYQIRVSKIGFTDAVVTINVNASGVNPIFVVVGVVIILILASQIWKALKQKRR